MPGSDVIVAQSSDPKELAAAVADGYHMVALKIAPNIEQAGKQVSADRQTERQNQMIRINTSRHAKGPSIAHHHHTRSHSQHQSLPPILFIISSSPSSPSFHNHPHHHLPHNLHHHRLD